MQSKLYLIEAMGLALAVKYAVFAQSTIATNALWFWLSFQVVVGMGLAGFLASSISKGQVVEGIIPSVKETLAAERSTLIISINLFLTWVLLYHPGTRTLGVLMAVSQAIGYLVVILMDRYLFMYEQENEKVVRYFE